MDRDEKEICMKFGSSVNQLVDNVELLVDDMLYGDEITQKRLEGIKLRINHMRKFERDYKSMLSVSNNDI